MTDVEVSTCKRIQTEPEFYYTVEDINIDIGEVGEGCTISYWQQGYEDKNFVRHTYLTISNEEAIAIAEAILALHQKKLLISGIMRLYTEMSNFFWHCAKSNTNRAGTSRSIFYSFSGV